MKRTEWYKVFSFCTPYFKPAWYRFAAILSIITIGGVIANIAPFFWGRIVDHVTSGNLKSLFLCLVFYLIATYSTFGLGALEGYLGSKLNYDIEGKIKTDILDKILNMRCADLDSFDTGMLMSRVTSDASTIVSFAFDVITSIITIVINIFSALFFSIQISLPLSIASIVFIPLSVFANLMFKRFFRVLSELQKKYGDKISSFFVGTFGHIYDTKAYSLEISQTRKFEQLVHEGWTLQKKGIILGNKSSIVTSLIASASVCTTIVFSAILIRNGLFSIGSMVTFQVYIEKLTSSVNKLLQMSYSAQAAGIAVERILEILDKPNEQAGGADLQCSVNGIELRNLTFGYKENTPILSNINFTINRPGVYAFVGENGCGKTTILKLLLGYYPPSEGEILINGRNIADFSLNTVRENIRYFPKDVYIQDGTLQENLLLGSKFSQNDSLPPDVYRICAELGLASFIENLPEKYNTIVGENGKFLSSGQKQKIAIARAILSDAPVLLFDEITSDLDGKSEKDVMSILHNLGKRKIIVLVTHRVASVYDATQVFFLKQGALVAAGTHDSLLKSVPQYCELFEKQRTAKPNQRMAKDNSFDLS